MLTYEDFLKALRDALNHLYDPDRLRKSSLVAHFHLESRPNPFLALQQVLTEAIQAARPRAQEPIHSVRWRMYTVLSQRYEQQFSQQQVAESLHLSVRQYRRLQDMALETLAATLWDSGEPPGPALVISPESVHSRPESAPDEDVGDELAWIDDLPPDETSDLAEIIPSVIALAESLALRHAVSIEADIAPDLPRAIIHPAVLRQAALALLNAAILQTTGRHVQVSAALRGWEVDVGVHSRPGEAGAPPVGSPETSANLELARRMAARYGGRLGVDSARSALALTVTLPALAQIPVLAIDDHADTLHLFQRYTVGTPYRLLATRDPGEALALAELHQPRIILVDVMMPRLDGWDVLTRLRQHPLTRETPIAICTVLAQEELALSLGASLFLRKPVNRDAFIRALEQLVAGQAQTPR